MPLAATKIDGLRKKIAAIPQKENKLKELATYEAKKALPVVLQILKEIHTELLQMPTPLPEIPSTIEFIEYGIKILEETDEKQNVGLFGIKKVLKGLSKEKIESELTKMVTDAQKIEVTHNTLKLWEEGSLWLDGLYTRIYDKVPKEKNGELKKNKHGLVDTVDAEDMLFNSIVHLTKFDIVSYYHQLAETINNKITLYQSRLEAEPVKQVLIENENKIEEEIKSQPKPSATHVFCRKKEGYVRISMDFLDGQEDKTEQLIEAYKKIMNINEDIHIEDEPAEEVVAKQIDEPEDLPLEFLEKYKNDSTDIKLPIMVCALDRYKLNDEQKFFLKSFKNVILASLQAYNNRSFTTWGLPTYLFSRPHVAEVEAKINKITASEDLATNLKDLFDLLIEVKGENSRTVKNKVTGLLEHSYTILLRNAKPMLQNSVRSEF